MQTEMAKANEIPGVCLATAESVVGIVIEGVFVAMIIQRFFR